MTTTFSPELTKAIARWQEAEKAFRAQYKINPWSSCEATRKAAGLRDRRWAKVERLGSQEHISYLHFHPELQAYLAEHFTPTA